MFEYLRRTDQCFHTWRLQSLQELHPDNQFFLLFWRYLGSLGTTMCSKFLRFLMVTFCLAALSTCAESSESGERRREETDVSTACQKQRTRKDADLLASPVCSQIVFKCHSLFAGSDYKTMSFPRVGFKRHLYILCLPNFLARRHFTQDFPILSLLLDIATEAFLRLPPCFSHRHIHTLFSLM